MLCGMLCRMLGMLTFWYVGRSICVMFGILCIKDVRFFWTIDFGMLKVGDIGFSGCGLFKKRSYFGLEMWNIYRIVG